MNYFLFQDRWQRKVAIISAVSSTCWYIEKDFHLNCLYFSHLYYLINQPKSKLLLILFNHCCSSLTCSGAHAERWKMIITVRIFSHSFTWIYLNHVPKQWKPEFLILKDLVTPFHWVKTFYTILKLIPFSNRVVIHHWLYREEEYDVT